MFQRYSLKQILLSQIGILVFATITVFFPQYYGFLLVAYIIIIPAIMVKTLSKQIKSSMIVGGKVLYEEKSNEIMEKDPEVEKLFSAQLKISLLQNLPVFVLLALGFTLWPLIPKIENKLLRFLAVLAYFESFSVLNIITNKIMLKKVSEVPRPISNFKITTEGIQIKPIGAIRFPLKDYELKINEKSSCIDLIPKVKGLPAYRIYTKDPRRVAEIIVKAHESNKP